MKHFLTKELLILLYCILGYDSLSAQGTLIDFTTIPKSGTILIYTHSDDDLIWMLPFWSITEKFIGGAMPRTPSFETIISQQQDFINSNGYDIDYASNWLTPWGSITQLEYDQYYWHMKPEYEYLAYDHLRSTWWDGDIRLNREEINRIKSKIEQYIADPNTSRIVTHNNWGEYGHLHHKTLNVAVRELAVKYRKDVWMLGCTINSGNFIDIDVPSGITYTLASFNKPALYTGIRNIYLNNGCWTWYGDIVPSGDHKFIKIIDGGVDKSNILTGETVSISGPSQLEPGTYIFDGDDDYLTLEGNNYPTFTVAMRIRPDQIREMDISKMAEYPSSGTFDRNLYMNNDGRVSARINDGTSEIVTTSTALTAGKWSHIVITGNGSNLKIYVNGVLENTISTGTAITGYTTPEFVLGQATETSSFFKGQIGDLRLYDFVMTDIMIAELARMNYKITASAGTGGSINPVGESTAYYGENRTFTFTPFEGYRISDVKVDNISVGKVSSYTINNITTDHIISVTFKPTITYTIVSNAESGGSITPSGVLTLIDETDQTYFITADIGFRIADVKIDDISVGALSTYTFINITANHTINATFATVPTFTINASSGTGGSINPTGTVVVNEGTDQNFIITPGTGYQVSDVYVDGVSVGSAANYTIRNVNASHTILAEFKTATYTITGSAGNGGSVNPSGMITANHGSSRTFNITPNTGYQISDVRVDNNSIGAVSSYTFNNIIANHTISASFTAITYTITGGAGTGGSVNPSGMITANHGSSRTFNITANTGYQISDVRVDNNSIGAVSSYTFNYITANHTISASFTAITYTITGSAGTGGSVNPSGIITANHGSDRTYNITANTGYRISDVRVDNNSIGTVSSYTFNNIIANHTISASFTAITYTITGSAGTGGSINPSGIITANHGSDRTYNITPGTGYKITDVRVDNNSIGAVSIYTFNNIIANHTISASFTAITYTITGSAGTGGSINPSGIITANHGSNLTYNINPAAGYKISDVKVGNITIGPVSNYTFSNITDNYTISATFTPKVYTITTSAGSGGSISPSGTVSAIHGSTESFKMTPDEGFKISEVKVDNTPIGTSTDYTFTNVTADHIISVTFILMNTYTISASSETDGSISPPGQVTIIEGKDQTYAIIPNAGFRIKDVIIDNLSIGAVTDYTFENVTSDHTISVTFSSHIEVIIFPNPFRDEFKIKIACPEGDQFDLYVHDITERTLYARYKIPGNTTTSIRLQAPPGIHIMKLYCNGKRVSVIKVVKQ